MRKNLALRSNLPGKGDIQQYALQLMFAEDIALFSEEIAQVQELLSRVDFEASKIGLHINAKKTELKTFNYEDEIIIVTIKGNKVANDLTFKYFQG